MFSRRKSIAFVGAAAAVAALGLSVYTASADATGAPSYTCTGGSIPGGTYSSLTVKGNCNVDDGDVHVVNNVTLKPNASLWAVFVGNDLTVGGSVSAGKNTNLILGCSDSDCATGNGEGSVGVTIRHDIVTAGARAVLINNSHIGGSITQSGGGGNGEDTCRDVVPNDVSLFLISPESDYVNDIIGGDLTITGVHTCELDVVDDTVGLSVTYTGNKTSDPSSNRIFDNEIARNLACVGNKPSPDKGNLPGNFVGGLTTGQCKDLGEVETTTVSDEAPRR